MQNMSHTKAPERVFNLYMNSCTMLHSTRPAHIYMYTIIACFILFVLLYARPKLCKDLPDDGSYISHERTNMINGIFIWIVFLSHLSSYGTSLHGPDTYILRLTGRMGQAMVSTFFFFTGYGIMTSLLRKGTTYATQLITHRFMRLWFHFCSAVLIYLLVQYCIGKTYPLSHILYSFAGWERIGNSNWFIFMTLLSYLLIAISYKLLYRKGILFVIGGILLLFICAIPLYHLKGSYWVNTFLGIPAGMLYCIMQKHIESLLKKTRLPIGIIGIICFVSGWETFLYFQRTTSIVSILLQNAGSILFAMGVCFIFAGIRLSRKPTFLIWSGGSALFYLYIFQRIPMLLGEHFELNIHHSFLYQAGCTSITILIAWICCRIFPRLDALIWRTTTAKHKKSD